MVKIKFRAFNKSENDMIDFDRNEFRFMPITNLKDEKFLKEFPIMQYTGLKDSKDTEIYEEDIITDGKYTFIVKWQSGGFILSPIKYSKNEPYIGRQVVEIQTSTYINESCKIIGNIYENEDLLKD